MISISSLQIHVVHPIVKFNNITRDSPDDEFEVLLQYALDTVGFRNHLLTRRDNS